jgi:putative endonuclease
MSEARLRRPALLDKMFFVYILLSLKDKKTYIGFTNNIQRRFDQHNAGLVRSTKYRTPFKLLFTENFTTSQEARKRELWWKSSSGRQKLKEYFK